LREIESVNTDEQARLKQLDFLTYQVNEIDAADLQVGEEEELNRRREILAHAETIGAALTLACSLCSEDGGVRDGLGQAAAALESVASFDADLADLSVRLTGIYEDLEDLISDLRTRMDAQSFDPSELSAVEERLDLIYRLKRKYGPSVEEILSFRNRAAAELDELNSAEERLETLSAEKERLVLLLKKAASALTESRKKAGKTLESVLTEQLAFLDMPNTGFCVSVSPAGTYTPYGADSVEFLLSANLGESLRPLSKIASGGELSRIMLCMKTVLTSAVDADTLIFDEVDTGVSGKAAEKIAIKLKEISRGKQVLVVTHLAQIAAYADSHFLISKSVSDQRTRTSVTPLDPEGRIGELARIMGGMAPTDATLAAAADLLSRGSGVR